MDVQAPGQAFAATFVDQLAAAGLRAACVCPGSRSAPLAMALARHGKIRVYVHVDERSGGFFALGLALATRTPVAVLTTSGTAAAELYPAVVEARLGRVPLVVLTADRPPELHDNGANQSIDQARLYGSFPRWWCDAGVPERFPGAPDHWRRLAVRALAEAAGPPAGPVHVNVPFREPLTPEPGSPARAEPPARPVRHVQGLAAPPPGAAGRLAASFERARRPVVVAGSMAGGERLAGTVEALARAGAPVLAEPTSGLRTAGVEGVVGEYDLVLRHLPWARAHAPDLVLRLGSAPTSRALASWLAEHAPPTWLVDPDRAWADPGGLASEVVACEPGPLLGELASAVRPQKRWLGEWKRASGAASRALERGLEGSQLHEGHVVRAISRALPAGATVVLGSSMAVRDADAFWPASGAGTRFLANRGASGIDGLVSTALGAAAGAAPGPLVALLGDLSLYHDMNGLWAARRHGLAATFVVLDNDGGGIFSFLPPAAHPDVFEEIFATPAGLRMEDVARLHGLAFTSVEAAADLEPALRASVGSGLASLVAVRFTREASLAGHRAAWQAVAAALGGAATTLEGP
ncbi:MAG: 2-succinyl-5-enolpyruvyl-6-hydroxy-3-cyclohexene-1-carboxylic-acid synthase [Candidatus Dormibacterales bacterium]